MQLQIMLNESAIDHVIKLSNNNPEVVKYFSKKLKEAASKRAKKDRKKLQKANAAKKKLEKIANGFRLDLIAKQTKSEKLFGQYLKELQIPFNFQKIFYTENSFYIVDFYLPQHNYVIEIDGKYHNDKEQRKADQRRTDVLKDKGITRVIRYKNSVVSRKQYCIERLKKQVHIPDNKG